MIIGIDAVPLSGRITGIGRYVLEICKKLDGQLPRAQFLLYSPMPLGISLPSERWRVRVGGASLARSVSTYGWLKVHVRRKAEGDGVQVFWAPRTILPARSRLFRTVSTVHDLNYKLFPQSMPPITRVAHRLWFEGDVRRADAVVANSTATADRLMAQLRIAATAVARPGVSDSLWSPPREYVVKRLTELGVRAPYFLTVGTVEPRKNLPALLRAFVSLKAQGQLTSYQLLIVGSRGWSDRRLRRHIKSAEMAGVHWTGYVPDTDLAVLYAGAAAFVCPSLYEGFGIPVLEARACGSRILASNLPEIREAGGPQGHYVPPTVEGLRDGLRQILRQPAAQKPVTATWAEAAETLAEQIESLAEPRSKSERRPCPGQVQR